VSQPEWEFIANLGDANPIENFGYFIFRDKTRVYTEEGELLDREQNNKRTIYRFPLDKCTYINGVLSDNKFHPEHPAWFAEHIPSLASCCDWNPEYLIKAFCSEYPLDRARAYQDLGQTYGFENLDEYPLSLTRKEVLERYKDLTD